MIKKLLLVSLALGISSIVAGQAPEGGKFSRTGLWLQNAVWHHGDDADASHPDVCNNPQTFITSSGEGELRAHRFFTSYLSMEIGEHQQRLLVMDPKGTVVADVQRGFRTARIKEGFPDTFQAKLDEVIEIPPQNTDERGRFGIWTVKIYADGILMREQPLPMLIKKSD